MNKEIWCIIHKDDGVTHAVCSTEEKAVDVLKELGVFAKYYSIELMWLDCLWEL